MARKLRFAAGAVVGTVDVSYQDDWQREGIREARAVVSWSYRLQELGTAEAETTLVRHVRLNGEWVHVPFIEGTWTMLDAAFTGMMLEAERKADESAARRFHSAMSTGMAEAWARAPLD
jgi:hypothetical protein